MDAIIYTSNTGTTEQYAKLLGEQTGLPVYDMKQAQKVKEGADIIYLGWLMASGIKGYKAAAEKWTIKVACGVCMGATGSQIKEVRERNAIPEGIPVFTLQGGLDMAKLHGIYKLMLKMVIQSAGKKLAAKPDKTAEEKAMCEMMMHGGNQVSVDNLKDVLAWLNDHKE